MKTPSDTFPADGLSPTQRQAIQHVLQQYPVVRYALLYGSRAMGRQHPGSDIDLTLMGDIDLMMLNTISNALDDLMLPYVIDLSAFDLIENQKLKDHIARVGKVFYTAHQQCL